MTVKTLAEAIEEAERFLQLAKTLQEKEADAKFSYFGSKASGAVRRASMDLTRTLADLRQGR